MCKKVIKHLLSMMVGLIIGLGMGLIAQWRMTPPLSKQYRQIGEEIYEKYLGDGVLPAPSTLSPSAQKILSEHQEIKYTLKDGLSYQYDKPYPSNLPLTGFFTLGFWWGEEGRCIGESQPPESLIHNAKLRAEKPH
jgi:hypothetical protein